MDRDPLELFLSNKADSSKPYYRTVINKFMEIIEKSDYTQVTKEDAIKYLDSIKKSLNESTVLRNRDYIKSFFNYLVRERFLNENPFNKIPVIPRKMGYVNTDRIPNSEELERIITTANKDLRIRSIFWLIYTSRFRIIELYNFKWECIFQDISGNWGVDLKSISGNQRIIPIRQDVLEMLLDYRESLVPYPDDNEYVFRNEKGNRLEQIGFRFLIKKLIKDAGVEKNISAKDIAHTGVTLSIMGGANAEQIKNQAGFSRLDSIRKYKYAVTALVDPACGYINFLKPDNK